MEKECNVLNHRNQVKNCVAAKRANETEEEKANNRLACNDRKSKMAKCAFTADLNLRKPVIWNKHAICAMCILGQYLPNFRFLSFSYPKTFLLLVTISYKG